MKIALYDHVCGIDLIVRTVSEWQRYMDSSPDYIRLSEFVEVDFPMLKDAEVVEKQLAAIDLQEQAARNQFQAQLDSFNERRANLRALTHSA